ncbi:hypothetical protein ACH3XW_25325 [Acanthocheilonema viteae]
MLELEVLLGIEQQNTMASTFKILEEDNHFLSNFDAIFLGIDNIKYDINGGNIRKESSIKVLKLFMRIPNI